MDDFNELQNRISDIRKSKGLSQKDVYEKIGMQKSNYSKLESTDILHVSLSKIFKISEVLEVSISEILDPETNLKLWKCETDIKHFKQQNDHFRLLYHSLLDAFNLIVYDTIKQLLLSNHDLQKKLNQNKKTKEIKNNLLEIIANKSLVTRFPINPFTYNANISEADIYKDDFEGAVMIDRKRDFVIRRIKDQIDRFFSENKVNSDKLANGEFKVTIFQSNQ